MKIDRLFVVSLGAITGLASCSSGQEEAQRPNILILLADDAGYADFGFMGATDIQTPNIDRGSRRVYLYGCSCGGDGEQPFAIHDADGPLRTTLRI